MKRILAIILVLVTVLSFAACGGKSSLKGKYIDQIAGLYSFDFKKDGSLQRIYKDSDPLIMDSWNLKNGIFSYRRGGGLFSSKETYDAVFEGDTLVLKSTQDGSIEYKLVPESEYSVDNLEMYVEIDGKKDVITAIKDTYDENELTFKNKYQDKDVVIVSKIESIGGEVYHDGRHMKSQMYLEGSYFVQTDGYELTLNDCKEGDLVKVKGNIHDCFVNVNIYQTTRHQVELEVLK